MKTEEISSSPHVEPPEQPLDATETTSRFKRLLAIAAIGLVIGGLAIAGLTGLLGVIGNLNQERAYSTDPEIVRARMRDIISIDLPDGFRPECSVVLYHTVTRKLLSQWAMYQWQDSDSFVFVARATRNLTMFQPPGQAERVSDAVDLQRIVNQILFDRGRIFEPLEFGPPEKPDDMRADGSLGPPRNSVPVITSERDFDEYLHRNRAENEEFETIELLGKQVRVWFASANGAVNYEPYWQVVTTVPTADGSLLFYLQVKKSELSREQIEAIVRSIREPKPATPPKQ